MEPTTNPPTETPTNETPGGMVSPQTPNQPAPSQADTTTQPFGPPANLNPAASLNPEVQPMVQPQVGAMPGTAVPTPDMMSQPQKYTIMQSLRDTSRALRANLGTFIIVFIVSALVVIGLAAGGGLLGTYIVSSLAPSFGAESIFLGFLIVGLMSLLVYSLGIAFFITSQCLALADKTLSVGAVLSKALALLPRVYVTNLLIYLLLYIPLFVFGIIGMINVASGSSDIAGALLLLGVMMLATVIWTVVVMLRFALVPYVAMFEPERPLLKTFGRSKQLLINGGQWFLFKGFLLLILVAIIVSIVTSGQSFGSGLAESRDTENIGNQIVSNIIFVIFSVIINGALVMLYRNRAAVRGQS